MTRKLADKLHPVAGYITITPQEETKIEGVIYNKEKEDAYVRGKVLKVGDGFLHDSGNFLGSPCKEGDIVLYSFSGFENVTQEGETIQVVRFSAIVAIIK